MPLAIGQSSDSAYFAGAIDEVALYRGALSASQVKAHQAAGAPPTAPPPVPAGDPVIAASGDIACAPDDASYNGGAGTSTKCRQASVAGLLSNSLAGILTLGDTQYEDGSLANFNKVYDFSWGGFKGITHPVPGNHEYYTSGASDYFDYFDGIGRTSGSAGKRGAGYYSYDIGSWHLIALNSNCGDVACTAGSAQEAWLRSDLAAHPAKCTLAYWHHPRFTSGGEGGGNSTFMSPIFKDLYNANADLVLSGHDHDYERFAPQNPSAKLDRTLGIREFVVGSGGKSHHAWGALAANSEVRNNATFGVLRLTLHKASYDWQFVPESGASFTDSGSGSCH
jgi:hypothetical protein